MCVAPRVPTADLCAPAARTPFVDRRQFLAAAAAAPFALGATPALARRVGGTPFALVTADAESRLVAYDLAARRVHSYVHTLPGPKSIETVGQGRLAVVAHTGIGAISIVDVATLRVRSVLHDFVEPRYTAAFPDGETALVTDAGSGELVTVDLFAGRVVHRLAVGHHARHVSLDPDSLTLWTALGFSAPEIVAVDLGGQEPRVAARITPPFHAHDVAFAPGGEHVWISSGDERRLAIYDAASRRVVRTLPAGPPPQHIAFSSTAAYVTSDDAVRVHRRSDGKLLRTLSVPGGSYNVTEGGGRIFTPSLEQGTLAVIEEEGSRHWAVNVARAAHDACFVVRR
jgi:DNA-binding beta-propeller fold protein YncE